MIVVRSHVRARAIPTETFVSGPTRDLSATATAMLNSKNRRVETRNKWHAPFVPISLSIFQIRFPETGWTREKGTRDQRLCQPARPYLLTIKHIHTRKYATYPNSRSIFKKWQNRHTNTLALRFSHIPLGRRPKLERTSRDASDTRA